MWNLLLVRNVMPCRLGVMNIIHVPNVPGVDVHVAD